MKQEFIVTGPEGYLGREFSCTCGKDHSFGIKEIVLEENALERIPALMEKFGYHHPFLVADTHTMTVAGEKLEGVLTKAGIPFAHHVFTEEHLVPTMENVKLVEAAVPEGTDVMIAVGSGTLNDSTKYASFEKGLPFFVAATAPSMDGYASDVAPLIIHNLKSTEKAQNPVAIVGDVEVLRNAPMNMIAAGIGDTLGKYVSLCDWEIGQMITGEYYCPNIAKMVRTSVDTMTANLHKVQSRDAETIVGITRALIMTGIAMSFAGVSRPASGAEHQNAHFWEMQELQDGKIPYLHGTEVGVGTILALKLYEGFLARADKIDLSKITYSHDEAKWEQEIRRAYRGAADGVLALEQRVKRNSRESWEARMANTKAHWGQIVSLAKTRLPSSQDFKRELSALGGPVSPAELDVSRERARDGLLYAKELRDRYTIQQLLWDLGLLEEVAEEVLNQLY